MEHRGARLTRPGLTAASLAALLCAACSGEADDHAVCSDSVCLSSALASAAPDSAVELAAGTFAGNFDVPAGVTVTGAGVDATTIKASDGAAAVSVGAGAATTKISGLTVAGAKHGAVSGPWAMTPAG